jgi:hypothetical protein
MQVDCAVEIETGAYSVRGGVTGARISIRHHGPEVAIHAETAGRQRVIDPALAPGSAGLDRGISPTKTTTPRTVALSEYERATGGGWQ